MKTVRSEFPILLILLLISDGLSAQTDSTGDWRSYDAYQRIQEGKDPGKKDTGKVRYVQDPSVDSLVAKYRRGNKEYPEIEGYRIQLYFGERDEAEDLRADFEEEYDDVPVYLDYHAPNFRLRVGDFRTRIEAYRCLQELGNDFGNPYIVRTKIELPDLKLPD